MANENEQSNGWDISLAGWKRKDQKGFVDAAAKTDSGEDHDAVIPFFVRAINKWPFPGLDPKKPSDYDELEIEQWDEVVQQISAAFRRKRKTG